MKKTKKYTGVIVPTITPLTASHQLDHEAVEKMFSNFRRYEVKPFILGTTGEAPSIPDPVRIDYVRLAAKLKQPGDVLYAGISSNCLQESVEMAKRWFGEGIDVVASTLPAYYVLTEDGMKKYWEQLADQVPGPLIIYNIPATTHMSIPLQIIDELSHHENIVGTKDSERSEERLQQSLSLWKDRDDFCHFLGWAAQSANALLNGSDGLIPSTGNLYPHIYYEMVQAVQKDDKESAFRFQKLSDQIGHVYQSGRLLGDSLAALKMLMYEAGLCQPHMMPPLQAVTEEEAGKLRSTLNEIISQEEFTFSNA